MVLSEDFNNVKKWLSSYIAEAGEGPAKRGFGTRGQIVPDCLAVGASTEFLVKMLRWF